MPIPADLIIDDVTIRLETDYPFKNILKYSIESKKDFKFEIRVPDAATNIMIDGINVDSKLPVFDIKAGEARKITVSFDFVPHFENYSYDLKYVKYGNLVFALPIEFDKVMHEYVKNNVERKFPYCDYELVPKSDWNYAFVGEELTAEEKAVGEIPFSFENPPVVINAKMQKIAWGFEDGFDTVCAKVPSSMESVDEPEDVCLVPYGCAKLRMTLMPMK